MSACPCTLVEATAAEGTGRRLFGLDPRILELLGSKVGGLVLLLAYSPSATLHAVGWGPAGHDCLLCCNCVPSLGQLQLVVAQAQPAHGQVSKLARCQVGASVPSLDHWLLASWQLAHCRASLGTFSLGAWRGCCCCRRLPALLEDAERHCCIALLRRKLAPTGSTARIAHWPCLS